MALKPDRKITDGTDISFFMNATAERGVAVILSAGGSGAAMDDASAVAALPSEAYASGQYVLGILLNDVVSGDLTRTHLNYNKDEVQVGSKVTVLRRGVITTNMVEGSPSAGQAAFVSSVGTDGKLCGVAFSAGAVTNFLVASGTQANFATGQLPSHNAVSVHNPMLTRVGTWLSNKDSDGYAKLEVNLI
jgi:hypothetical protein